MQIPNVRPPRIIGKQLTARDKSALLALRLAGKTFTDIAKILNVDRRTVARLHKRIVDRNSFDRKVGSGKQRQTTPRENAQILRKVKEDRFTTSIQIKRDLPDLRVGPRTIRRRINDCSELRCCWQTKKPFVSEANRIRRVAWCREHLKWTQEQWAKVLWSDESPFVYRFAQRRRVWRTNDEKYSAVTTKATVKHDKKINVWGCFARHGVGRLHLIDGIMLKEQYAGIVEDQFYPSAVDLFPGFGDEDSEVEVIFQEDNDPQHTANIIQRWWEDQQLTRMEWPSQSPDLNPIETLWSLLDKTARDRNPNTDLELFNALSEAWNALDPELLASLVDSMPRRCQAVIDSNGYATEY